MMKLLCFHIIVGFLTALVISLASADNEDATWGGLYPRESESREVKSLDDLWNFRLAPMHEPDVGFNEKWFSKPLATVSIIVLLVIF